MIFVFGSNLAGIHGAGAAKVAHQKYGARWGSGVGFNGFSYAIPTKDHNIRTMLISSITPHIFEFLCCAKYYYPSVVNDRDGTSYEFKVTRIGCGLAGLKDEHIAPLFHGAPDNCYFDEKWRPILGSEGYRYWGTF